MIEPNYHEWLKNKSKIENFDKLSYSIKEAIYDVEQDLTDTDEVNLVEVLIGDDDRSELFFDWVGYEKEMEIIAELTNTTSDNVHRVIIAGELQHMQTTVEEYFYHLMFRSPPCRVSLRIDENLL